MKNKKENKTKQEKGKEDAPHTLSPENQLSTKSEAKSFLLNVRDKLIDEAAAPIYAMTALNQLLTSNKIYEILDNENREIARDIWLRLRQSGLQLRSPALLFEEEKSVAKG